MAVTRHRWLVASMTADSIVVLGSEKVFRLSHEHTGIMPGKRGFGVGSAARAPISAIAINVAKRTGLKRR
jgi:hypothetical protein